MASPHFIYRSEAFKPSRTIYHKSIPGYHGSTARLADTAPSGLQSGSRRWSQEARQKFQSELEAAQAAKRRACQEKRQNNMADYNTANEADVNPKMEFRLEFNHEDPELWFTTLERNKLTRGIKSEQYLSPTCQPKFKQSADPS